MTFSERGVTAPLTMKKLANSFMKSCSLVRNVEVDAFDAEVAAVAAGVAEDMETLFPTGPH